MSVKMLTDKLNQNEAVVCVVGPGYVGLPLAVTAVLSVMSNGWLVTGDG